jgi:hypothetical protein
MWTKNETTGQLELVFLGELISVGNNVQQNSKGTEFRIGSVKLPNGKVKSCRIYEKSFAHGMTIGTSYKCTATQYQDANNNLAIDLLMSHFTFIEVTSDKENAVLNSQPGFPAPIKRNLEDKNQNNKIENAEKLFKEVLETNPTVSFKAIAGRLFNEFGTDKLDHNFNLLAEAWNNVALDKVSTNEVKNIYENLFGSQDIDLANITGNQTQESNPKVETKAVEKSLKPTVEKTNVVTDFVFDFVVPIIIYLLYISIPIGIFFDAYFKDIFNFKDDFSFSNYENENNGVFAFLFSMFIIGIFYVKEISEETENPYIKILYSVNSIKFHFIISVILIAIVLYYLTISIVLIILIWSLFTLDGYSSKWKFTKTVFYKWVKNIFK